MAKNRIGQFALASLIVCTLTFFAARPAAAVGSEQTGVAAPGATDRRSPQPAGRARTSRQRPPRQLSVAQKIDASVRRLTRGLKLDAGQQQKLREILVDQHRKILALRSGASGPRPDVAGTTLAIYDQSKARIRAMLNDEQKKKYSADVPRDGLAPAQADLKHWMDLQESKRRQDQAEDHTK